MIVHIFNDQKKFSLGYFRFLRDSGFDLSGTVVWHYGKRGGDFAACGVSPRFIRSWFWPFGHYRMYRDLVAADRIIIHSLASPFLIGMLRLNPSLCRKVWWVIWGKDLYLYQLAERKSLPLRLYEAFRKPVIRNIAHIIAALPGDYTLAKAWYGVRADYIPCPMLYPYCIDYGGDGPAAAETEGRQVLMLGNSASKTNEHEAALRILSGRVDRAEKVYCPLSYGGSRRYARRIAALGRELLGPAFTPLIDYLPFEEYRRIWNSITIAVFNQKRQEALGNIYSLIMMKKTVCLRPGTSTADFMRKIGVETPAFGKEFELKELPAEVREANAAKLMEYIRPEKSREAWSGVLPRNEKGENGLE
jgi:hypothetical protein